ncbi:hypothetical protein ACRQE1_07390 [Actinotignum sp. GS-2025b]|nr:hypothetical protein [Actinotignum timonense]MDY5158006.1 hypothetical protein [Actinotignum timonense]
MMSTHSDSSARVLTLCKRLVATAQLDNQKRLLVSDKDEQGRIS